jgi:hypothetical protein
VAPNSAVPAAILAPVSAPRRRLGFTPALLGLALCAACEHDEGQVELNWTLVDRAGGQVFPSGVLPDLCDFTGLLAATDTDPVPYALRVQLRLCEPGCPAGCDDPSCQLQVLHYPCDAARGFSTVPARAEAPYDIHIDLVATADSATCGCTVNPPCALVPGPRSRNIEPGLVTDLQVYLLVLGLDDIDAARDGDRTRLDLATCCTPDPSCG